MEKQPRSPLRSIARTLRRTRKPRSKFSRWEEGQAAVLSPVESKAKGRTVRSLNKGRGASAVEFALILPLLVILIFGIIEFSLALYDKAMITNASREGARSGIVYRLPPVGDGEIIGVVNSYLGNYLITF